MSLIFVLLFSTVSATIIPIFPLPPRGISPQAIQVVSNVTNITYGVDCECDGLIPCPPEREPVQCDYVQGTFNSTALVSSDSELFAQVYIPTVTLGFFELIFYVTQCPINRVFSLYLVIDTTFILWPADNINRFTWTTRPTTTNYDLFLISNFNCSQLLSSSSLPLRVGVNKNLGPIMNVIKQTGQVFTTLFFRTTSPQPVEIVLPFGYNSSVSATLPGSFGSDRLTSNYSSVVNPYILRDFALTQLGNEQYPIGFPEDSESFVPFQNVFTETELLRLLNDVPDEISNSAVLPGPLVQTVFVLNLDGVPSDPSFYNKTALELFFQQPGNFFPYFAPYGICVSTHMNMSLPFCTPSPYNSYPMELSSVSTFTEPFSLRNSGGNSIGNLSVVYEDAPIANISGSLFYPMKGLLISTKKNAGSQARFYMQIFALNVSNSPDFTPDNTLIRTSNVVTVNVSAYEINTGPVATNPIVNATVLSDGFVSGFVPLTNDADGVSGFVVDVEPLLGTVSFNPALREWTYFSFQYFNSLDDNFNRSDYFVFRVLDSSNSPCDEPFPQYTTNLKNPVVPCMGCGLCASNPITVSVYVIPVYYPPTLVNSSFSVVNSPSAAVVFVIDTDDYNLPMPGDFITQVNMPLSTANGVVSFVPSFCCFIYTYSVTNPSFFGVEAIPYTVTSNRNLTSNVAYVVITVT